MSAVVLGTEWKTLCNDLRFTATVRVRRRNYAVILV